MKAGWRSCLLTLALGLTLAVPCAAQSLRRNGFRGLGRPAVVPSATACGPVFLTHSVSQDIISGNSIACADSGSGFTFETHYTRVFDLPGLGIDGFMEICEVQVAVEAAIALAGTQAVTVYLYATPAGTFPGGPLTPIGTAVVDVPDQDQSLLLVPMTATVPSGSALVVDVASENGVMNLSAFVIGSNNLGQTAPSYLTAPDCGIPSPTDLANIPPGFPDMHIVVNALGTEYLAAADPLRVDERSGGIASSNTNGVFEPGETVWVDPSWTNRTAGTLTFSTEAASFTGPPGPAYVVKDGTAAYGATDPGATSDCFNATGDCYGLEVTGARPVQHWDASFDEVESSLSTPSTAGSVVKSWTLHVGESFPDAPTSNIFYTFIETLLHNRITSGCAGGLYCPTAPVTRAQMAVFLLKAKHGAAYVPSSCGGTFPDVACPSLFADWIEQLAAEGITAGCGGGFYCPDNPVTRAQMAVFLLKAKEGALYAPPVATGIFDDVAQGNSFAPWIEELYHRNVTGGCQAAPLRYCPANPNTRGQMAVFLVKAFGLRLYGA